MPWRVGATSMRVFVFAITSAAFSTSCHESRKKAMWCSPLVGAADEGDVVRRARAAIQVAAWMLPPGPPSPAR
jgi:hypothetical protein